VTVRIDRVLTILSPARKIAALDEIFVYPPAVGVKPTVELSISQSGPTHGRAVVSIGPVVTT
jgi:hypothetical protein